MIEQFRFIEIHGGPDDGNIDKCADVREMDLDEVLSIEDQFGHNYRVLKVECGALHLQYAGTKDAKPLNTEWTFKSQAFSPEGNKT